MDKEGVVRIYNGILLSHKKNKRMSFAGKWMDLNFVILSEVSQTEKDKYHMMLLMYEIYIKKEKVKMDLFTIQKYNHRCKKLTWFLGIKWGRVNWKIRIEIYLLLYIQ